jgi:hypothetical protein
MEVPMSRSPAIYNTIRAVVSEFGGSEALADELCTRVGDEIEDAVGERFSQQFREEDPPPRRLGHTEIEASMRACPFAREVIALDGKRERSVGNRYTGPDGGDYANPAGCRCIGSYCMAWRWLDALRGCCGMTERPRYQPLGEPRRLANRTPLERPSESLARDLELLNE